MLELTPVETEAPIERSEQCIFLSQGHPLRNCAQIQNSPLPCALAKSALSEKREEGWRHCPSALGTYIFFLKRCIRYVSSAILPHPHSSGWDSWQRVGRSPTTHTKPFSRWGNQGLQRSGALLAFKAVWLPSLLSTPLSDLSSTHPPWIVAWVHLSGTGWVFPACLRFYGGNKNKGTKPLFYFWTPTGDGWKDGKGCRNWSLGTLTK